MFLDRAEKNFGDLAQSNFLNFIFRCLSFKITFRIDLELSFTNVVEISLWHNPERMLITLPGSVAGRITVEIINYQYPQKYGTWQGI